MPKEHATSRPESCAWVFKEVPTCICDTYFYLMDLSDSIAVCYLFCAPFFQFLMLVLGLVI